MVVLFISNFLVYSCKIVSKILEFDGVNIVKKLKVKEKHLFYEKVSKIWYLEFFVKIRSLFQNITSIANSTSFKFCFQFYK